MGVTLNPLSWGWISTPQGLKPKMMTKDAAPQHLLRIISYGCTKGCGNACSCKKAGLKCSSVCRHCRGASCNNIPDVAVVDIPGGDDLSDVKMEDDLWAQDVDDSSPSPDGDMPFQYVDPDTNEPQPGPSKRAKLI
ncbi:unnamed protein product [Larinioides sclopetarius]|uniref:Tesmin/TSO1-like CXC domain-containing protein n=1 Tax=Larinioides sclopetarius TaxID=280406 RepID=A0AAV2AYT5_9ARAC